MKIINQYYRPDIQIFRGFSIVIVVLYHLNIPGFHNGYLGVDIFFVLSGFLMAVLVEKYNSIEFYERRFKRLIPAYLVTIFITTLFIILLTEPVDANQSFDRIFFNLFGFSNFAFWLESSYFDGRYFKPLLHLWSLSIEVQFYLFAPFLLPFLRRHKIILTSVILISFLAALIFLTISPKTSFFLLPTRLWEFLFGACVAWFAPMYRESKTINFLRISLIFLLIIIIVFYPLPTNSFNIFTGHVGIGAFLLVICVSTLIFLRIDKIFPSKFFISNFLIKLGDYSYSIYLTHFPIIILINYRPFGGTLLGYSSALDLILILTLTFVFSYFLFNYVEKLRYDKNIITPTIWLFIICSLLGIFGPKIISLKYTEKELLIHNAWENKEAYRCSKVHRLLNPISKTCQLGESKSDKKVLLLGNSHSYSIKTAFTNAMDEYDLSTYFYVSNTPLMSEKNDQTIVLNEIKKNKINHVVFHYDSTFFNVQSNTLRLAALINLIKNIDVSFYFIAPVPIHDIHVPQGMLKELNQANYKFPNTTITEYYSLNSSFLKFIKDNQVDSNFIKYPHLILCNSDKCLYEKDGVPYYYDQDHLTLAGAQSLSPLLNELAFTLSSSD